MCRGSAVYQVKVDLSNLGYACSCPSRKFPCKHVLGLLMLRAASPEAAPQSSEPDWVTDWLSRRRERAEKKSAPVEQEAAPATDKKVVDEKAQRRRAQQRESRVSDGLERLDVWLKDVVRNGLANVETKPAPFWEEQAKRLVDAQAGGMATRVSRWSEIPRSGRDWPTRLLIELGLAKLLIQAWQRFDSLDA
ncbi:MAG: SWIM zinc finger family protein, partial [Planctomycetales bacterium]|nr:SWIM zinc finger family protein [Planctomycetales bacterium]